MVHNDLPRLVSELLRCYLLSIKHKPNSKNSHFHIHYEKHMVGLAREILARKYTPWRVRFFVVQKPKPREIVAAHLRDRAIHHLIYERLSPAWERRFSPYSYACRKEKGPLRANEELGKFLRHNKNKTLFALKMDISNFFQSINRKILRGQLDQVPMDEETTYLVDQTLFFDQVSHCVRVGTGWETLPPHKSLFNRPVGIGLPIGNLTSQFFANVYLNDLDHWIAAKIPQGTVLFWQRYVDDILVIGRDSSELKQISLDYDRMVQEQLQLNLNPTKTQIQPVCRGIDQLGFIHTSTHVRIRDRVKNNLKRAVKDITVGPREADPEAVAQINSYLGLIKHADTMRLLKKMVTELTSQSELVTRYNCDAVRLPRP